MYTDQNSNGFTDYLEVYDNNEIAKIKHTVLTHNQKKDIQLGNSNLLKSKNLNTYQDGVIRTSSNQNNMYKPNKTDFDFRKFVKNYGNIKNQVSYYENQNIALDHKLQQTILQKNPKEHQILKMFYDLKGTEMKNDEESLPSENTNRNK